MEGKLRDKRVRAIAELMVKADKDRVTRAEFHAEYDRLAKGLNTVEVLLRVMPLYRQMVGDTAGTSFVLTDEGFLGLGSDQVYIRSSEV